MFNPGSFKISGLFKKKIYLFHKSLPTSIPYCTDFVLPDNQTPVIFFRVVAYSQTVVFIDVCKDCSCFLFISEHLVSCRRHHSLYRPALESQIRVYSAISKVEADFYVTEIN